MPTDDIALVRAHVEATIGSDPRQWTEWRGGWPGDIESALIDAVFSARAVYETNGGRGISRDIGDWRSSRTRSAFSLKALLTEINAMGVAEWAGSFGNRQLSPGRGTDEPHGPSKAAAVWEAAGKLRAQDIDTADDINVGTAATAKDALRSVSGIGYATSSYFLMLLGVPGVKPDRMIHRFLSEATGHAFTNADAAKAIRAVAAIFGVQEHELDHAIWGYERNRARRRRHERAQGRSGAEPGLRAAGCVGRPTPGDATLHAGPRLTCLGAACPDLWYWPGRSSGPGDDGGTDDHVGVSAGDEQADDKPGAQGETVHDAQQLRANPDSAPVELAGVPLDGMDGGGPERARVLA